jgi:hypothetical protein
MFKSIKNSRLDEQSEIAIRMAVFNAFMPEGLAEDPVDPARLVRGYMEAAKGQAATVDRVLSKILTALICWSTPAE